MMTYNEALEYIHSISWTFCKPGLERTYDLCKRLGNPQDDLKFIHVAGTNGKGSFCSMLSEILHTAGYKTGLYTSPYIKRFNERMQINGSPISDDELASITEHVRPIADAMADKPTEFELITAIAFEYFKRNGVDVVVLEAGMGGRLDSTNVIKTPLLSVITGVALDHTAFLGDTVEKIAKEKAGIIKNGIPVLFGGTDAAAYDVIRDHAEKCGAPLTRTDNSAIRVKKTTLDGTVFDYREIYGAEISLLGSYQPHNASNVIEATRILRDQGLTISESDIRKGLKKAKWPARFEIIHRDPLIIYDGAHNREGVEAAVESIKRYFASDKVIAISGVLADKEYTEIARKISEVASRVYTITPDNPRALTAEAYSDEFKKHGINATPCASISEAVSLAVKDAKNNAMALVCLGSLYTYLDVTEAIEKEI